VSLWVKLICLNTSGGKLYDQFSSFLQRFQKTTDLFCLQEVFTHPPTSGFKTGDPERVADLYERLERQLRGFTGYLTEPYTSFGERLALFVRDSFKVDNYGDTVLCPQRDVIVDKRSFSVGSRFQWIGFHRGKKRCTVANMHGMWFPSGKEDSSERLIQSDSIVRFITHVEGGQDALWRLQSTITNPLYQYAWQHLRNLIREYAITSTRSSHYSKNEKFADYIFTSADVRVLDFHVLENEVSDHLPLLLEFDLR